MARKIDINMFVISQYHVHHPSSSSGLHNGGQTGSEGRAHRPEWNSTYRGHSGTRGAGRPKQVGKVPQNKDRRFHEFEVFCMNEMEVKHV